jgi:hypothetical protein
MKHIQTEQILRNLHRLRESIIQNNVQCFINNGYCKGGIEVHHSVIELSAANGVDWEKVKIDYPNIDHADDDDQMMDLCEKHHRGKYTGIHNMSYNIWILQKYMNQEALKDFENAVQNN